MTDGAVDGSIFFDGWYKTRNLERSLFAFDDLLVPPVAQQLPSKLATFVARISNDGTKSRPERRKPGQQPPASSAVRHVSRFGSVAKFGL